MRMVLAVLIGFSSVAFAACEHDAVPGAVVDRDAGGGGGGGGGDGDGGGDAGTGPSVLSPCPETSPPPTLAALRQAVVGTWRGATTSPWSSEYETRVTFTQDGHYSAHTLTPGGPPALNYGIDDDSPRKTYLLDDIHANGDGSGQIEVVFDLGPGTPNRGSLERVRRCAERAGQRLDFEFWATWGGRFGPVAFRLLRE